MSRYRRLLGPLLALLLSGCSGGLRLAPARPEAPAPPPIRIGVITSRTGPLAGYGDQELRGLQLGLEYATGGSMAVGGRRIELLIRDDEGKPELGALLAKELIDQAGADILQGTASSAVAAEVIPVARQRRRVFVIAPAGDDALTGRLFNKYLFRVSPTASQEILAGATNAARLGKSIAVLAPDSAWGRATAAAWQSVVEKTAPTDRLLEPVYAPLDAADFTPYLQRTAAPNPEVCVLLWPGEGVTQLFNRAAAQGLFRRTKVTGIIGDRKSLQAIPGAAGLVGALAYSYTFPHNAANDWLVVHHQEKYKEPPDLFTASGFNAGLAIGSALVRTGGDTGGDRLVAVMEGLTLETVSGRLTFRRQDHQALQPLYIAELKEEQGVLLPVLVREVPAREVAPPVQAVR